MRTPSGRAVFKATPASYDTEYKAIQTAVGCHPLGEIPIYGRHEYTVQLMYRFKTVKALHNFEAKLGFATYFHFSARPFAIQEFAECYNDGKKPWALLITGHAESNKHHPLRA